MKRHNPMQWNCGDQGCFNKKRRPKIEMFGECFPGNINFGDVDGLVEINGRALFLEWKSPESRSIPKGQEIYMQRLTSDGMAAWIIVTGDAETMEVSQFQLVTRGIFRPVVQTNLDGVKAEIARWAIWAKNQRVAA